MDKATIADVAKLAGVSIKTVSRVTNHEPNVAESTRVRVESAIAQLGYRPNPSARSLASRRSYLIGLLYDNPSPSYLINIQHGSLRTCRSEGYDLVIHPCDYRSSDLAVDLTAMLRQSRVDGVILTPPLSDLADVVEVLEKRQTPFVRIAPADGRFEPQSITTNDQEISAQMTEHLVALGHRRIGFICGHPDHGSVCKRYDGYVAGLASASLPLQNELVAQGYNSVESGEHSANVLLDLEDPPTAIFAANDDMAAGALRAAHERGIPVPGRLSVAGFDDTPIAQQVWPSLTTIRQPIKQMAERATALLLSQLNEETGGESESNRLIPCGLVLRDSTARVAP